MKKGIKIAICIIAGVIVLAGIIIGVTYLTSKRLVCKSSQGNITLMYNDKTIKGYTAKKITYDLDTQQKLAEEMGVDAYLEEFKTWFSNATDGTCK